MIVETTQGSVNIDVTTTLLDSPKGKIPVDKVGILLGGGSGSALLCYLLAKDISLSDMDITIVPLILKESGLEERLKKIHSQLDIIKDLFKDVKFADAVTHEAKHKFDFDENVWHRDITAFHKARRELVESAYFPKGDIGKPEGFQHRLIDQVYSGIVGQPPEEVLKSFKEKDPNYFIWDEDYLNSIEESNFIMPLLETNKKGCYEIYVKEHIANTVLQLTAGCEGFGDKKCYECNSCYDEHWAYPDDPVYSLEDVLGGANGYPIG
jgi:hypothetical protein